MTDKEKEEMMEKYQDYIKLGIMPIDPGTEKYKYGGTPSGGGGCPTCGGYLWVIAGSGPQPGTVGICDGCMAKAADMYKASKKLNFLE
jgi:hypothetical protein